MVKGGPNQETTPQEFAEAPPRDLYPISDIRFVLVEIGRLGTKVDRLIDDVKSHNDKIDAVRHQVSFVKGALWVIAGVLAFVVFMVSAYFSGKLNITLKPGA